MFGYVRTDRAELKVREDMWYQGVYCGLCRVLGKRYGFLARMTLNYDFTFLALFRMSLTDTKGQMQQRRCFIHPLHKRPCLQPNEQLEYAADAGQLLVYYKWNDVMRDEKGLYRFGAKLLTPYMRGIHKKASSFRPELDAAFARCMENQYALEKRGEPSVDAAAEPTAEMMCAMVCDLAQSDAQRRVLERFGYCFGRWIYFTDAADDLEKDRKKGTYNPFVAGGKADALSALNACTAECCAAYELLDNRLYDGLIRNILERGMPSVSKRIAEGTYRARRRKYERSL